MTLSAILVKLTDLGLTAEQVEGVLELFYSQTPGAIRTRRWRHKRDVTRVTPVTPVTPTVTSVTPIEQNQGVKASQVLRKGGTKGGIMSKQGKILSISSPKVVDLFPEPLPESINPDRPTKVTNTRARPKNGTRLPDDWEPDHADTLRIADELNFDPVVVQFELAKFRDYWLAKSGANATKRDWQATWRNWLRKVSETPVSKFKPRMTEREKADAVFREAIRQAEAREQSGEDDLEPLSNGDERRGWLRP